MFAVAGLLFWPARSLRPTHCFVVRLKPDRKPVRYN
jgi:hypothetical protein